jgi:hypothetical protein
LIVYDEPDVLETSDELLEMCVIDFAREFEKAKIFLQTESYNAVIFDIRGVVFRKLSQYTLKRLIVGFLAGYAALVLFWQPG